MAGTTYPTVRLETSGSIQSPVLVLTQDATTTKAVLDLTAWAGQYVSVVFVGDDGWIACSATNAAGSISAATRSSTASNTHGNSMLPMIEGTAVPMIVSEAYPYLVFQAATAAVSGTATISVQRA